MHSSHHNDWKHWKWKHIVDRIPSLCFPFFFFLNPEWKTKLFGGRFLQHFTTCLLALIRFNQGGGITAKKNNKGLKVNIIRIGNSQSIHNRGYGAPSVSRKTPIFSTKAHERANQCNFKANALRRLIWKHAQSSLTDSLSLCLTRCFNKAHPAIQDQ